MHVYFITPNKHTISCAGEDWQQARMKGATPLHILEPTGLGVNLRKSIVTDDAFLPRYKCVCEQTIKLVLVQCSGNRCCGLFFFIAC